MAALLEIVGCRFVDLALCRQAMDVRLFGFMTAKRDISALWRLRVPGGLENVAPNTLVRLC